jgi:hypothetical protein
MALVLKHLFATRTCVSQPHHLSYKYGRDEAKARVALESRVVYVGNLAFTTSDSQLRAVFCRIGPIERVVIGLNKITKMPAGFAFIIFFERYSAIEAVNTLNLSVLDGRPIQVQLDKAFAWHVSIEDGFYASSKIFGKGETGGQGRDERGDFFRDIYDEQRGGLLTGNPTEILEKLSGGSGGIAGRGSSTSSSGGFQRRGRGRGGFNRGGYSNGGERGRGGGISSGFTRRSSTTFTSPGGSGGGDGDGTSLPKRNFTEERILSMEDERGGGGGGGGRGEEEEEEDGGRKRKRNDEDE